MEEMKVVQDGVEVATIDVTEKTELSPVESNGSGGTSKAVIAVAAAGVIGIGLLVAKKLRDRKRRNEEEAEIEVENGEDFKEVDDPDEVEPVEGTVEPEKK